MPRIIIWTIFFPLRGFHDVEPGSITIRFLVLTGQKVSMGSLPESKRLGKHCSLGVVQESGVGPYRDSSLIVAFRFVWTNRIHGLCGSGLACTSNNMKIQYHALKSRKRLVCSHTGILCQLSKLILYEVIRKEHVSIVPAECSWVSMNFVAGGTSIIKCVPCMFILMQFYMKGRWCIIVRYKWQAPTR